MELTISLYGATAAVIDDVTMNRWLDAEARSAHGPRAEPPITRLSAVWRGWPAMRQPNLWLEGALPENGMRELYEAQATAQRMRRGLPTDEIGVAEALWTNANAEYPGAIGFRRAEANDARDAQHDRRLSDTEIAQRLHAVHEITEQRRYRAHDDETLTATALSGVRGKSGLTLLGDGTWAGAERGGLNTWVLKHEQDPRRAGQAGIEAISQRTTALLGIRSPPPAAQASCATAPPRCARTVDAGDTAATHRRTSP